MKKLPLLFIMGCLLAAATGVFALTLDEARTKIESLARSKGLEQEEQTRIIAALQDLVNRALPVEYAARVVETAIERGISAEQTGDIARSIMAAPGPAARSDSAVLAVNALRKGYTSRETVTLTETFRKTVAAGAPAETTALVMNAGVAKGRAVNRVEGVTNTFAGEVRSGIEPGRAAENAIRALDRELGD